MNKLEIFLILSSFFILFSLVKGNSVGYNGDGIEYDDLEGMIDAPDIYNCRVDKSVISQGCKTVTPTICSTIVECNDHINSYIVNGQKAVINVVGGDYDQYDCPSYQSPDGMFTNGVSLTIRAIRPSSSDPLPSFSCNGPFIKVTGSVPFTLSKVNINSISTTPLTQQCVLVDVQNSYGSTPTTSILGCTISNCKTNGQSGAAVSTNYGPLLVNSSTFNDNSASQSGGGVLDSFASINIVYSKFNGNIGQNGGVIYSESAQVTVSGSSFFNNTSPSGGGGVFYLTGTSSLNISGSSFLINSAEYGGVAFIQYSSVYPVDIFGSLLQQNYAQYDGGVIYFNDVESTGNFSSSIFALNSAGQIASDVYFQQPAATYQAPLPFNGGMFFGGSAPDYYSMYPSFPTYMGNVMNSYVAQPNQCPSDLVALYEKGMNMYSCFGIQGINYCVNGYALIDPNTFEITQCTCFENYEGLSCSEYNPSSSANSNNIYPESSEYDYSSDNNQASNSESSDNSLWYPSSSSTINESGSSTEQSSSEQDSNNAIAILDVFVFTTFFIFATALLVKQIMKGYYDEIRV